LAVRLYEYCTNVRWYLQFTLVNVTLKRIVTHQYSHVMLILRLLNEKDEMLKLISKQYKFIANYVII
jgi:hypothetical protein